MCCFSGPVQVANTKIFARGADDGRQHLVYEMTFASLQELAMILPLPVPRHTREGAVQFINLDTYPRFFKDLDAAFPVSRGLRAGAVAAAAAPLRVVSVGSYEASFVPSPAAFARLDARFRLSETVWKQLPLYADYGFAVFKLKPDATTVHPMALMFPTREPERLFFPTVHIHDGKVHRKADFDHSLYCQVSEGTHALAHWLRSEHSLALAAEKAQGILDPALSCYKRRLAGRYQNRDVWVPEKSGGTLWSQLVGWVSS